ncbi:MAG TPA: HlyD family efflux transporter periplasmic adaptor subunit [Sphingomonadaceae bacterium]|nr:HlyD family efflux transporter periplasmic adaptor subunit [Sphingomonadaceae bacterium]
MNRRRMAVIGAAVALLILLIVGFTTDGFGLFGGKDRQLVLHGNVDIRQVDLGFRVSGRIATMPFEEGARVAAGTALANLDAAPLKDQLEAAEAQVAATKAELDKRRNGNRPQEIAQAQARLAEANASLARSRADLDRRTGLVKTGAISQALFLETQQQYRAAEAEAAAARQALSLQRAGARREDIDAAAAQHAQAIAQRDKARTDLADATLHAPHAGVILTRAREPGAIVQPGETVLTLTIDRPMRVRAYIDEPDLGRISPGMPVEVTADGNPKTYHGTIGYISPAAEFTPKTVQTEDLRANLVYRIRVIVSDPDDALRQGAPVTVTVPQARAKSE